VTRRRPCSTLDRYDVAYPVRVAIDARLQPASSRAAGLLDEYAEARSALIMLMLATFAEAVHDLPDARAGDLFDRFLAWPWPTG